MRNYNPIIIAMGVESQHKEPDSETENDASSLLKRAQDKQKDGHIAKFSADGSLVTFCDAEGNTDAAAPTAFKEGLPALYFLVHGSHGALMTSMPGEKIEAACLYKAAIELSKHVKRDFAYINIVACGLLKDSFKPKPPENENGETNIILPLARFFNNEKTKPIIAAYRQIVYVEEDGSKTVGRTVGSQKAAQGGDTKNYKSVYRFDKGSWARCKNFHNKAKVVKGNARTFEDLAPEWNELGPLDGN